MPMPTGSDRQRVDVGVNAHGVHQALGQRLGHNRGNHNNQGANHRGVGQHAEGKHGDHDQDQIPLVRPLDLVVDGRQYPQQAAGQPEIQVFDRIVVDELLGRGD